MLASLEGEVRGQTGLLTDLVRGVTLTLPRGSILVGAGDSYAAALCASYMSPLGLIALDPYELAASRDLARAKTVVFVSVSGRTRSNVSAARNIRGGAAATIAVTADASSPLAKAVGQTILIPYKQEPRTPGMASFSLSLAVCARLGGAGPRVNFQAAYEAGRKATRGLVFSRSGTTYFLGNLALYGVSVYAAAKLYEFFGARAHSQRLEEFSHMELFSLQRGDAINIYGGSDPLGLGPALSRSLRRAGYISSHTSTGLKKEPEAVFAAVFATQLAVLRRAEETGIVRPYIVSAGKKLCLSDSMIY